MQRVTVELSPEHWPSGVRSAFETALFPLFLSGQMEGMQVSWYQEASDPDGAWDVKDRYVFRAWGAADKWKYAIHRYEYSYLN